MGYIATSGVWFQSLPKYNPVAINTGANGLQRLDATVRAAEKYGIKLIIPFVNWFNEVGKTIPATANMSCILTRAFHRTPTSFHKESKPTQTIL